MPLAQLGGYLHELRDPAGQHFDRTANADAALQSEDPECSVDDAIRDQTAAPAPPIASSKVVLMEQSSRGVDSSWTVGGQTSACLCDSEQRACGLVDPPVSLKILGWRHGWRRSILDNHRHGGNDCRDGRHCKGLSEILCKRFL